MEFYIVHFRKYRIKMDTKPSSMMEVDECKNMKNNILCKNLHGLHPNENFRKMSN
ncbi:hypothetical protein BA6E_101374 [Bacteroidales bacterium 6E]|nr:hypothetical protein BA6E_101374 [Bacteroidales bacterium 6E]